MKIAIEDFEMLDILLRKQSVTVLYRFCPVILKLSYSDSTLVQAQVKLKALVEEDSSRVNTTPFEKHFIESLFVNKFQEKVLEYPELDTKEEVEALKKHAFIAQKLITGKNKNENENDNALCAFDAEEAVSVLKKFELTGFKFPRIKNGFGYLSSEYTYMQEALGLNPSLSKTINEHEDFGVYLIDSFGTDIQKDQYLVRLINGEYIASLATVENNDVSLFKDSLNTSATFLPDNQSYKISGEKSWVYNANYANLFILSANIIDLNGKKATKPTLFLVDRNTPGIEIQPIEKIGLKNLSVCNVTFNEVIVPSSCVLGNVNDCNEIMKKVLSRGKLNSGAHCLAIMKKVLNKAIDHCIYNEFFNEDKCDNDYYKMKIGQIVSRIYVVESMTYLLTGRLDSHTDSDVFLESVIVKIFATDSLLFVLKQVMDIIGPEILKSDESFLDLYKDSQFYVACDEANDYFRLVLSTAGINYARDYYSNIFNRFSDIFSIQTALVLFFGKDSTIVYKNILQGYLHQMFSVESKALEACIFTLYDCTQFLIKKFGNDVFKRHLELKNLADILIDTYATAATLGRASRAYCLGMRNQKVDQFCAEIETMRCYFRILTASKSIESKVSSSFTSIAPRILNFSKYSDLYSVTKSLMIPSKLNSRSSRSQQKQL